MVIADILKKNFNNFKEIKIKENTFNYFECAQLPDTRVLMTSGLSKFKMNVHEKHLGEEYAELFFLLPVYWNEKDLFEKENEWVFSCLLKIQQHVQNNNTWIGNGHTFLMKELIAPFFKKSTLSHFMVSDPIELNQLLKPVVLEHKTIRFLALIPLYKNEFSFKEARGTFKMEEKLSQYRVTEKMDGFRESVIKSRISRLFKR